MCVRMCGCVCMYVFVCLHTYEMRQNKSVFDLSSIIKAKASSKNAYLLLIVLSMNETILKLTGEKN